MKHTLIFAALSIALTACGPGREESGYRDLTSDRDSKTESSETESSKAKSDEGQHQIESGQITAAEWNDLANWDFWESLNQRSDFSSMSRYWNYHFDNRIAVHIRNSKSESLVDIPVELITEEGDVLWKSKTDNKGNAELWPALKGTTQYELKKLKIRVAGESFKNIVGYSHKEVNRIVLVDQENANNNEKKIDIAFVVDATGSMGDELEFLKAELTDVIDKVKSKNNQVLINTGTVFYKDQGDDYVTRKSDFTSDLDETVNFIKEQSADGGGDFPEAVHTALQEAISDLQWSPHATARLLFLVLDAPPHHEDQITSEINHLIELASSKGITIIPITASGIDKETEFLMRYMAIATNGSYVFITNDSGIGNAHIEASVGNYQVEYLNKLMERLINERLQ